MTSAADSPRQPSDDVPQSVPRRRAPKGQGERLRGEILSAAERLLIERGDAAAVSVAAIAKAVGVSPPSIYMHFADKDALIRAVAEAAFDKLDASIDAAVVGSDDPVEELASRLRAYINFGLNHPAHYSILLMGKHAISRSDFEAGTLPGMRSFEALIDNVRRCMDSGAFIDEDPVLLTCVLWAAVHGVTTLRITFADFPLSGDLDQMVQLMLRSLTRGLEPGQGATDTATPGGPSTPGLTS